jgi:hypothetical protein
MEAAVAAELKEVELEWSDEDACSQMPEVGR